MFLGAAGTLGPALRTRLKEVFDVLSQELPAPWEITRDQLIGCHPILDRAG